MIIRVTHYGTEEVIHMLGTREPCHKTFSKSGHLSQPLIERGQNDQIRGESLRVICISQGLKRQYIPNSRFRPEDHLFTNWWLNTFCFAYHMHGHFYSLCLIISVLFELCAILKEMIRYVSFNDKISIVY